MRAPVHVLAVTTLFALACSNEGPGGANTHGSGGTFSTASGTQGGASGTVPGSPSGGSSTPGAMGPAGGASSFVPTECPNAAEDGYSILRDPAWDSYQIRKVGALTFSRYEKDASGAEIVVSEDYQVVTAFPKRYLLSVVHAGKTFPIEERDGYYVVDSNYELPHIPCVTDDLIYAPIVSGFSSPTVTERGQNKGWPIQQDISAEVQLYQGKTKMWVYTTWPGYRYGYWFKDASGAVRPTWLFSANGGQVTFQKYTPTAAGWPEGAYNDVPYGLHIDNTGKVYVPKPQPIEFPQRDGKAPPPTQLKLAYKDWDSELRCVVINKSRSIVANTRTIWPGGSEAYYPAESFLPGYAVIGQDSDGYWGLKGRETDAAAWWAGDDCVDGRCSGQSRMPYRNGCRIDGYDFAQGDGFNWLELKDRMIELGVIIPPEQLYRLKIYLQEKATEPARMLAELYYEQAADGRWLPKLNPGKNTYNLTGGDNPRYIINGHIWPGQRVFGVIEDL
ncbi:MAG TPA: hypothetical protein VKP30_27795 [Polyangiaceae bacterium]|nr:hypothetical protein [Polyangiaceae bacterium]